MELLQIIAFLCLIALSYSFSQYVKQAKKISLEEDLRESLITPKQREGIYIKQNKRHKFFIYIALVGILLMFVLKNTFVGYFIGFGCLILMGGNLTVLGIRWTKKQPWEPKILIISFLLLILIISLIAYLYYPQLQYMYQDRIK